MTDEYDDQLSSPLFTCSECGSTDGFSLRINYEPVTLKRCAEIECGNCGAKFAPVDDYESITVRFD